MGCFPLSDRHIHILGICGTFMGGVAALARELGIRVSGSDREVYPPMSDQLQDLGIVLQEGYDAGHMEPPPDEVVVGNALSRGNPAVEAMLERGLNYCSGPEWLAREVLRKRWVIAVAGTHGKTTTASMIAWILEYAGLEPGFLIGGVPANFPVSARLGSSPFFVIEADEYDTAFFDKRSKFVHYRPRTLVINNLEYDHADIFPDLAAIQRQFHHLVRTVPGGGLLIRPVNAPSVDEMLAMGAWTPQLQLGEGGEIMAANVDKGEVAFDIVIKGETAGRVRWALRGRHNLENALAAIAAARHAGVAPAAAIDALSRFANYFMRERPEHEAVLSLASCALRPAQRDAAHLEAERGVSAVFDRIEQACPALLRGHRASTEALGDEWMRNYPGLDARLQTHGERIVLERYLALSYVDFGPLSAWQRGEAATPPACRGQP
jgi:UDP-N-acetylmuramate: L-alanyl-gamma-D-glutamyl-meso-diaminopimelate ligase